MHTKNFALWTTRAALAGLFSLGPGVGSAAEPSINDMVVEHFFTPDIIKQEQTVLNLTEEQKVFIQMEVQKTQERLTNCQAKIRQEAEAFVPLVNSARIDEPKALAQMDKILGYENDIKRTQLAMLIHIKNKLTPEQQGWLKRTTSLQSIIQDKLTRIGNLILQWERQGKDISSMQQFKQQFDPLMREGKLKEAEAVLDRALAKLEGKAGK
jgi:Spy/CpxP family protein refolding chaperone